MNAAQLTEQLDTFLALPAETEWVEFKSAKNSYDFGKLGQYFSALSNEAALAGQTVAWLIFGVNDQRQIVGTRYRPDRAKLDSLKREIADKTSNRLSFVEIHELAHPKGRVLLFEIPAALPGMPTSWEGHFYGREGESLAPLSLAEQDRIRARNQPDWSAQIAEEATLDDLDSTAIATARTRFKEKHPNLASEVDNWDDTVFLNKARIAINGRITHTAILLLGRDESSHFLSPAQAQMSWVLKNAGGTPRDYRHFGPPFLLNTEALFDCVRNLTYRYMGDATLFPTEVSQYDPWVMRELLHNCIAHQDYRRNGRISVVELEDALIFANPGSFIPRTVEQVIASNAPPDEYRNPFLARAMVELVMIDTIGSGILKIFTTQRQRFFPLPDYDLSDPKRVEVTLFGKILDENYTRALMRKTDLELHEVMALDKVQKRKPLDNTEFKLLKNNNLIEGRRPNIYVASSVAQLTDKKAAYIRNRGLDKTHYKEMVLEYLRTYQQAAPKELEELLLDKMPDILDDKQKRTRIRNLLQEMSKTDQTIRNAGGRAQGARWVLVE
jgi:ATP-dependent DNA helicase RecG